MIYRTFEGVQNGQYYFIDFENNGYEWIIDVFWGPARYTRYMDADLSLKDVFVEMSEEFPDMKWSD